jgi:peptidoglycan/LPS O-acetylase OafA/YrhL
VGERTHSNSFDLLRLVAALGVLWFHQGLLLGLDHWPRLPWLPVPPAQQNTGILGVFVFFAVSGYLNTLSLAGSRSAVRFLINRALRIYPGLAGCMAFTLALGFFFSTRAPYVDLDLVSYAAKNTLLLFGYRTTVPGIFEGGGLPGILNGSLWTLPYEGKLYLALALGLVVARFNLLAPVALFVAAAALAASGHLPGDDWGVHFSILFGAGAAIACLQMLGSLRLALLCAAGAAALVAALGNLSFATDVLLATAVVAAGNLPCWRALRPPLDISYGIYLYGFPIQQAVVLAVTHDFWRALALSFGIVLCAAVLSARFIEGPALRLKRRRAAAPAAIVTPASEAARA